MKISVDGLTATPAAQRYAPGKDWWRPGQPEQAGGAEVEWMSEPIFDLSLARVGQNVDLRGRFEGSIGMPCGRCLKRYRHALQSTFHLILEPLGDQVSLDPEGGESLERDGICLGEELESGWYRGDEIELDSFLSEVIALAWPAQPVCRADCPGLCPQCGVDRSQTSCECEIPKPESPFAVLEALRGGETGSS